MSRTSQCYRIPGCLGWKAVWEILHCAEKYIMNIIWVHGKHCLEVGEQISAPHRVSDPMGRQLLVFWACPQGMLLNAHCAWLKKHSCWETLCLILMGSVPCASVCNEGKKGKQKVNWDLSFCKIVLAPTEFILLVPFFQNCCPATLTEMEVVSLLLKLVTLLILNEPFDWINHSSIKYCWAIIYIHPFHPEWFCRYLLNAALHY